MDKKHYFTSSQNEIFGGYTNCLSTNFLAIIFLPTTSYLPTTTKKSHLCHNEPQTSVRFQICWYILLVITISLFLLMTFKTLEARVFQAVILLIQWFSLMISNRFCSTVEKDCRCYPGKSRTISSKNDLISQWLWL